MLAEQWEYTILQPLGWGIVKYDSIKRAAEVKCQVNLAGVPI